MPTDTKPAPADITIDGPASLLRVTWKDGHQSDYPLLEVRRRCPCAQCNEERARPPDPLRILTPAQLATPKVEAAELVGLYALKIRWQDGHDTGIYAWEFLRALCPCPTCAAERGA